MYLYQETYYTRLEEILKELTVTDPVIVQWFKKTFTKHMRAKPHMSMRMYVGAHFPHSEHVFAWSKLPMAVREAVMRDEEVMVLLPNKLHRPDVAAALRGVEEFRAKRADVDIAGIDAATAITVGRKSIQADVARARDADARLGTVTLDTSDSEYDLVGLFTYGALDVAGHDLMNCLRGEFGTAENGRFDRGITYFGLREKTRCRIHSIAEVKYIEASVVTDSTDRAFMVTSHLEASNHRASRTKTAALTTMLSKFLGTTKEAHALLKDYKRCTFKLVDGKPTAVSYQYVKAVTPAYEYQRRAMGELIKLSRSFTRFDFLALYNRGANANSELWSDAELSDTGFVSAPEVNKQGKIATKLLQHRNAQRVSARCEPSRMLRGLTQRLANTDRVADNTSVILPSRAAHARQNETGAQAPDTTEGDRQQDYYIRLLQPELRFPDNTPAIETPDTVGMAGFRRDDFVMWAANQTVQQVAITKRVLDRRHLVVANTAACNVPVESAGLIERITSDRLAQYSLQAEGRMERPRGSGDA